MLKTTLQKHKHSPPPFVQTNHVQLLPRPTFPRRGTLDDAGLAEWICGSPINKGDFVFYGDKERQTADLGRIGYVFDIEWDSDVVKYNHDGSWPMPFAVLPLNYTIPYYRQPQWDMLIKFPRNRWDHCIGNSVLSEEIRKEVVDDYVQDYISKYSKRELIR